MLKKFFAKKDPGPGAPVAAATLPVRGAKPVFEVRETQVCAQLQMSKDEVRLRRQYFLVQGQHWDYVDKRVLLSRVGAEILRGTREAIVPPDSAKNGAAADCGPVKRAVAGLLPEKNPPPVEFQGELVAWGVPARNPKLLIAYIEGTDPNNPLNLVSVSVRSNVNFLRGMKLKAVRVENNHFELVGVPPRWRGRW